MVGAGAGAADDVIVIIVVGAGAWGCTTAFCTTGSCAGADDETGAAATGATGLTSSFLGW